ncbi:8130_t:CDS:1, partial [Acaulospora morrowiae]
GIVINKVFEHMFGDIMENFQPSLMVDLQFMIKIFSKQDDAF